MEICICSMFCCRLLYAPSSFAISLMGEREQVALLGLSSWCLVVVVWLFLAVPWVCLQFVIVVFPHHTHLLFSCQIWYVFFLIGSFFLLVRTLFWYLIISAKVPFSFLLCAFVYISVTVHINCIVTR